MSSGTGLGLNGQSTLETVASQAPTHPQIALVTSRRRSPMDPEASMFNDFLGENTVEPNDS